MRKIAFCFISFLTLSLPIFGYMDEDTYGEERRIRDTVIDGPRIEDEQMKILKILGQKDYRKTGNALGVWVTNPTGKTELKVMVSGGSKKIAEKIRDEISTSNLSEDAKALGLGDVLAMCDDIPRDYDSFIRAVEAGNDESIGRDEELIKGFLEALLSYAGEIAAIMSTLDTNTRKIAQTAEKDLKTAMVAGCSYRDKVNSFFEFVFKLDPSGQKTTIRLLLQYLDEKTANSGAAEKLTDEISKIIAKQVLGEMKKTLDANLCRYAKQIADWSSKKTLGSEIETAMAEIANIGKRAKEEMDAYDKEFEIKTKQIVSNISRGLSWLKKSLHTEVILTWLKSKSSVKLASNKPILSSYRPCVSCALLPLIREHCSGPNGIRFYCLYPDSSREHYRDSTELEQIGTPIYRVTLPVAH